MPSFVRPTKLCLFRQGKTILVAFPAGDREANTLAAHENKNRTNHELDNTSLQRVPQLWLINP